MSVDIKELGDRFAQIGRFDVARKLDDILEEFSDTLPESIPERTIPENTQIGGYVFEYKGSKYPLTREALGDPRYFNPINRLLFSNPELGKQFPRHLVTRSMNTILRGFWPNESVSMSDILGCTDDDLLGVRNMGHKTLQIYHAAVHPLREALQSIPQFA